MEYGRHTMQHIGSILHYIANAFGKTGFANTEANAREAIATAAQDAARIGGGTATGGLELLAELFTKAAQHCRS